MDNKKLFREFCLTAPPIPIFMNDWWLDTVCGPTNWGVVMAVNDKQIQAVMPYPITKKFGFTQMLQPLLTPQLGPWIIYPDNLPDEKKIGFEHKIYKALINQLPAFDRFAMGFNPMFTNWQAFHWKGFKQTTRYTYIVNPVQDRLDKKIRKKINLASETIKVEEGNDLKLFFNLQEQVYQRQGKRGYFNFNFLENLDKALVKRNNRKILFAKDFNGNTHAAIYLLWDSVYMYLLMSGINNSFRDSQAKSLLVYEGIQEAKKANLLFNFEGSMIESVESFHRHFGPIQQPYFYISKTNSRLLKWFLAVR